jgi:hypothetical protein
MRTYTIYTQCDHCGVYDRDPQWCALCQKPKEAERGEKTPGAATGPRKIDGLLVADLDHRR